MQNKKKRKEKKLKTARDDRGHYKCTSNSMACWLNSPEIISISIYRYTITQTLNKQYKRALNILPQRTGGFSSLPHSLSGNNKTIYCSVGAMPHAHISTRRQKFQFVFPPFFFLFASLNFVYERPFDMYLK